MTNGEFREFREKCAEVEGWIDNGGLWINPSQQILFGTLPTYDNEVDLLRVVRLLGDQNLFNFFNILSEIVQGGNLDDSVLYSYETWRATADQMREALMKTLEQS